MKNTLTFLVSLLFGLLVATGAGAQSIIGAWTVGDTTGEGSSVIVFLANGTYIGIQNARADEAPHASTASTWNLYVEPGDRCILRSPRFRTSTAIRACRIQRRFGRYADDYGRHRDAQRPRRYRNGHSRDRSEPDRRRVGVCQHCAGQFGDHRFPAKRRLFHGPGWRFDRSDRRPQRARRHRARHLFMGPRDGCHHLQARRLRPM